MTTITETQMKLRDAGIQMKLAMEYVSDENIFRACVNAFIAAARSIVDVMKTESLDNEQLLQWYESAVVVLDAVPVVRFFGKQRTLTIHRGVVHARSESSPVYNLRIDGKQVLENATMTAWFFDDVEKQIPGDNGNVPRLCQQYFLVMKDFVYAWLNMRETFGVLT